MPPRWTPDEDKLLREIYRSSSKKDILDAIHKDWMAIRRRALKLDLHRDPELINNDRKIKGPRKDSWSSEEDRILTELYSEYSREDILARIHRSWSAIAGHAQILGLKRDEEFLQKNRIAASKIAYREDYWSPEEDSILRDIYENSIRETIMSSFSKRTWKAIRERAIKLGLKRNNELIQIEKLQTQRDNTLKKTDGKYQHPIQMPSTRAAIIATNLKRRGVKFPTQSQEVRDKVSKTVIDRYGVTNVFQSEDIKAKIRETNTQKYGFENPQQNKAIKSKTEDTNLSRYGVRNLFERSDLIAEGMIKKYGKSHPQQVESIKLRTIKTNLEKYGHERPCQNKDIREELIKKLRSPETKIKKYITYRKNESFSYSKEEKDLLIFLREIDPDVKTQQIHPILNHIIDFYMPLYGVYIQYDGAYWHGKMNKENKGEQSDNIKKIVLRDRLQEEQIPNLIRLWSDETTAAIRSGSIIEFITDKINEKLNQFTPLCHQYKKKLEWFSHDLEILPFNHLNLKASDFSLNRECLTEEIREFICRYEWKGNIGESPKWVFTARYKGFLGGAVLISEPTQYSKILGEETKKFEAQINRGASSSWAPKNLSSRLIMYSCRWMIKNTDKRAFIGYADPGANERGVIYRACNFEFLGSNFGSAFECRHPEINKGSFSPQYLRKTSTFKRWCYNNNIPLKKEWFKSNGYKDLSTIPPEIKNKWYEWGNRIVSESEKTHLDKKSKYVLVLARTRKELRYLNSIKTYKPQPYHGKSNKTSPIATHPISVTTNSRKTTAKIKYIEDNYGKLSRLEIARDLNESVRWVKRQIYNLRRKSSSP